MKIFLMKHKILIVCVCTHICIWIAAYFGWLNIFFSGAALHLPDPRWGNIFQGIDFYDIPSGAWAVLHGGSLTGVPLQGKVYAPGQVVNPNVYHPLFTLALGSILMQFSPHTAYYVWMWAKLPLSLASVSYFYWSFRTHKYVQFATCILLINFNIYLELAAGQYQFLLNIFLLIFITTLVKRSPPALSSAFYFLALIVKPIGLLFIPALIIKKQWRVAVPALVVFALTTLLFLKDPYYIHYIMENVFHPSSPGPVQIVALNALLRYTFHWPDLVYKLLQYGSLALILALISLKRMHISKALFLMVVYFLCFYNQVYEYDWSVLPYVIAPCVMYNTSFQTRLSRACIVLTCLPSCFVILALLHIDIGALNVPGAFAWQFMVVSKLIPLFLLCGSVLWDDIKHARITLARGYAVYWHNVLICFKEGKII